ncbi:uncharacterized protein LOC122167399 [Centrocercus urophasianus]|uniref:uncharacterized protein LOC122167399 n=1 Tax=Centrocercus urophasianus TaxID=9002 RepID=UPI001C646A8F|nr:uncharacterized protein LOC122167399 [Centrocercus urophasianus]
MGTTNTAALALRPCRERLQAEPAAASRPRLGFMAGLVYGLGITKGKMSLSLLNVTSSPGVEELPSSAGGGRWQRDEVKCLELALLRPLPRLNLQGGAVLKYSWGFPRVNSIKNAGPDAAEHRPHNQPGTGDAAQSCGSPAAELRMEHDSANTAAKTLCTTWRLLLLLLGVMGLLAAAVAGAWLLGWHLGGPQPHEGSAKPQASDTVTACSEGEEQPVVRGATGGGFPLPTAPTEPEILLDSESLLNLSLSSAACCNGFTLLLHPPALPSSGARRAPTFACSLPAKPG